MEINEEVLSLAHRAPAGKAFRHQRGPPDQHRRPPAHAFATHGEVLSGHPVGRGAAAGATEMEKARREFVAALQVLTSAPENTAAIKDELALGQQQWMFFENALTARGGDRKSAALNVATTSERLLEVMNTVTGLYEKVAGQEVIRQRA
ncbi:MAG: hypothetical protein M5R42_07900 [Rhodocyclaceae bacterium]|nr:hypothetical protein [Rhodocyclaceae bacterium]